MLKEYEENRRIYKFSRNMSLDNDSKKFNGGRSIEARSNEGKIRIVGRIIVEFYFCIGREANLHVGKNLQEIVE